MGLASGRHTQQVLRVDHESTAAIEEETENQLLAAAGETLLEASVLLISDYGKGVCTPRVVSELISCAAEAGIPVVVDPARGEDFSKYAGASLLVPNRLEAELAADREILDLEGARVASCLIRERYGFPAVLLKLDRDGMFVLDGSKNGVHIPARAREVYDITGAGDMVLAALGLALASNLSLRDAAALANMAAGIEVDRLGVAPVTRAELVLEATKQWKAAGAVPLPVEMVGAVIEFYRLRQQQVVLLTVRYDTLVHSPISYLRAVAARGDILIVAVSTPTREAETAPVGPHRDSILELLNTLRCVHHVVLHDSPVEDVIARAQAHVVVCPGDP